MLPTSYIPSSNFTVDPQPLDAKGTHNAYRGTLVGSAVRIERARAYVLQGHRKPPKVCFDITAPSASLN